MRVVLAHGAFDVLHAGHIEHLRAARALGDRLVVSVSTDEVVARRKPGRPIMGIAERLELLRALGFVDLVWVCPSEDAADAIRLFCPSYFVKGNDYAIQTLSKGERDACREVGAKITFTMTHKKSSTELIERIKGTAA